MFKIMGIIALSWMFITGAKAQTPSNSELYLRYVKYVEKEELGEFAHAIGSNSIQYYEFPIHRSYKRYFRLYDLYQRMNDVTAVLDNAVTKGHVEFWQNISPDDLQIHIIPIYNRYTQQLKPNIGYNQYTQNPYIEDPKKNKEVEQKRYDVLPQYLGDIYALLLEFNKDPNTLLALYDFFPFVSDEYLALALYRDNTPSHMIQQIINLGVETNKPYVIQSSDYWVDSGEYMPVFPIHFAVYHKDAKMFIDGYLDRFKNIGSDNYLQSPATISGSQLSSGEWAIKKGLTTPYKIETSVFMRSFMRAYSSGKIAYPDKLSAFSSYQDGVLWFLAKEPDVLFTGDSCRASSIYGQGAVIWRKDNKYTEKDKQITRIIKNLFENHPFIKGKDVVDYDRDYKYYDNPSCQ